MTRPDLRSADAVWTETFRVRSYEADPGGRASIQTICNYLQEAASNHAAELGVSIEHLTEEHLLWMLARLRVEVDVYPRWREEMTIETWPSGSDRLYATRDFLMRGAEGLLGRATSAWLLVDAARRRPVRLPELFSRFEIPDRERALEDLPAKLPDPPESAVEMPVRVRFSDQDLIGHVNNVMYLSWSVESVPPEIIERYTVRSLEVQFRAEARFGDEVVVFTAPVESGAAHAESGTAPVASDAAPVASVATPLEGDDAPSFLHLVASGDRELARVRSTWRKR